jgi:hypothetical protein
MLRSSSWLNETPWCRTAVNSLTGIEIIPKLIVPLQIDLAIGAGRYLLPAALILPPISCGLVGT